MVVLIILAPGRLNQEDDHGFKDSLWYIVSAVQYPASNKQDKTKQNKMLAMLPKTIYGFSTTPIRIAIPSFTGLKKIKS